MAIISKIKKDWQKPIVALAIALRERFFLKTLNADSIINCGLKGVIVCPAGMNLQRVFV